MKTEYQGRAEQILRELYSILILYNHPNFDMGVQFGGLADIAFRQFNSRETGGAQQKFEELSNLIEESAPHANEFSTLIDRDIVVFNRENRGISFIKNERYQGLSYQEIYYRRNLYLGYTLHAISVERERKESSIKSSVDVGIYITDPKGTITFKNSFNYKTSNRLVYGKLMELFSKSAEMAIKYDAFTILLTLIQRAGKDLDGIYSRSIIRAVKNNDLIKKAHKNMPSSENFKREKYEIRK